MINYIGSFEPSILFYEAPKRTKRVVFDEIDHFQKQVNICKKELIEIGATIVFNKEQLHELKKIFNNINCIWNSKGLGYVLLNYKEVI